MTRYVLAYDSRCGLCTRFKRALAFLDPRHKFTYVSLLEADSAGVLDAVPHHLRHSSFHVISAPWEVYSAADGVIKVIELMPAGRIVSKILTLAPLGTRSVRFLYSTLSRLHDTGNCSSRQSSEASTGASDAAEALITRVGAMIRSYRA